MENTTAPTYLDREHIEGWLADYLADLLELDTEAIDSSLSFERYGLDSSAMIVLSGDLQNWLNCSLKPTLLYDYPTIDALVTYLLENIVHPT
jgi:acyl carrier protein